MTREPLDVDRARRITGVSSERARRISEVTAAHTAGELALRAEQRAMKVKETADAKIAEFETVIMAAAEKAAKAATMTYSERISASRNSPEKVAAIEQFAADVASLVYDEFTERGFKITMSEEEVRDFRDTVDAQPEYFDTHFVASW